MPVSATTSITMTGSKAISTKQRSRFKGGKSKNDLRQKDQRETRDQSIAAIREVLEDVLTKSPAEFDWDHSGQNGPLEEIERQRAFEKAMKGWPWRTELVPDRVLTQAPHAMNEYNYDNVCSLAQVKQISSLFKLGSDMEHKIMNILFSEGHLAASGLAATCQEAFHLVAFWVSHWDVSRGHYCDCELTPKSEHARVTEVVVASPFRIRERCEDPFGLQVINLHKMTVALRNFSENFVTLHLHRIPLLTIGLLTLVIPYMRKLKFLGVYACELLHLGHLEDLLRIIRTDRGTGMTKSIKLDFYPRFHVGPDPEAVDNINDYSGSYAATWDNFCGLDTRLGIWAIVSSAMATAEAQEIDLVSKGTALRLWLDKSPCWKVEETIKVIQRRPLNTVNAIKTATMVNYPNTKGKESRYYGDGDSTWSIDRHQCISCPRTRLGVFFDYEEFQMYEHLRGSNPTHGTGLTCLGCKLNKHMEAERDHYKNAKNGIIKKWLTVGDVEIREDLSQAAEIEAVRPAINMARRLDRMIAKKRLEGLREAGAPGIDCEVQIQKVGRGMIRQYSPCIVRDKKDTTPNQW